MILTLHTPATQAFYPYQPMPRTQWGRRWAIIREQIPRQSANIPEVPRPRYRPVKFPAWWRAVGGHWNQGDLASSRLSFVDGQFVTCDMATLLMVPSGAEAPSVWSPVAPDSNLGSHALSPYAHGPPAAEIEEMGRATHAELACHNWPSSLPSLFAVGADPVAAHLALFRFQ